MKRLTFKTIRGKLTFWFLLLAILPLLTALVVTYFQRVSVIESQSFDKLTAIRDLKSQQLDSWLDERTGDLKVISSDFELRKLEQVFDVNSKSFMDKEAIELSAKMLRLFLTSYSHYEEVFFISAKTGLIELSTNQNHQGLNKLHNTYFTEPIQTGTSYLKNIYHSETTGKLCMTISAPVYGLIKKDQIIGVVVLRIDLNNSLFKILSNRVGLGETGETLIVNKDVIALNELRWYENAPLNLKIKAQPAVNAARGETGITSTPDYRKVEVLAAYTHIAATGWGFVCKQDKEELNSPIREMLMNFVLIFLLSTLVITFLALYVSKSLSRPVVAIYKVAQKIGAGDFSVKNKIESEDELGVLAKEFNKMADAIQSRLQVQNGVVAISETMIGKSDMKEFGNSLLMLFMKITEANMSTFYLLNEATLEYEHFASIGVHEDMLSSFRAENAQGEIGSALSTKSIYHLKNIPDDTAFKFKTMAGTAIPKEMITIPIIVENAVVALISLASIRPFSSECTDIIKQAWLSINTSYANLISGERTRILADYLADTNQRLEAQAEELQEQSEELQNQTEELQRSSDDLQAQNIELEAQRLQVEAANKMKSEFLSNMSHELRTPLNSIMALSRVLIMQASSKLSEEENSYLEIVERNGKRLLSLINDILDLSKVEAGKMDIHPGSVSFHQTLQMVKENIQSIAEEKNISLNLKLNGSLPVIETDETRLHQVLTNIVGNAVKFTDHGRVDITARQKNKNIEIEVKDTGIGIAKEMLPHIFEEFRQADGSTSRSYEGTGLGLAIAHKMTHILGGSISVESELGIGSVFTITLPIKWHESRLADELRFHEPLTQAPSPNALAMNTNPDAIPTTTILLVEDNRDAIVQVKAVLEKEGYKVEVANGGMEALAFVQHTIPDGIVLDLMMPDIDGFQVLENIRRTAKTRTIPVLILTAKDLTAKDLSRLSANNVQQLIQKGDVDIEGLLAKIKLMLAKQSEATLVKSKPKQPIQPADLIPLLGNAHEANKRSVKLSESSTVLIIEDHADNMVTLKAILQDRYKILEATDGKKGLALAESSLPDLILLDMSLPEMNGEAVVKALKLNSQTKHINVIAVTAQNMKGDRERFLEAGCDGYVAKPIDQIELMNEIGKLLIG